jgi:predicted kinase
MTVSVERVRRTPTLTITRGLPASGKTTWARARQASDPTVVLVSRDELRATLHGGRYSPANEEQVVAVRDAVVVDSLARGRDVIVHDTNLNPAHVRALEALARLHGAGFAIEDFTGVPLEVCITRDASRANAVGEGVIRAMWGEHLRPAETEG